MSMVFEHVKAAVSRWSRETWGRACSVRMGHSFECNCPQVLYHQTNDAFPLSMLFFFVLAHYGNRDGVKVSLPPTIEAVMALRKMLASVMETSNVLGHLKWAELVKLGTAKLPETTLPRSHGASAPPTGGSPKQLPCIPKKKKVILRPPPGPMLSPSSMPSFTPSVTSGHDEEGSDQVSREVMNAMLDEITSREEDDSRALVSSLINQLVLSPEAGESGEGVGKGTMAGPAGVTTAGETPPEEVGTSTGAQERAHTGDVPMEEEGASKESENKTSGSEGKLVVVTDEEVAPVEEKVQGGGSDNDFFDTTGEEGASKEDEVEDEEEEYFPPLGQQAPLHGGEGEHAVVMEEGDGHDADGEGAARDATPFEYVPGDVGTEIDHGHDKEDGDDEDPLEK